MKSQTTAIKTSKLSQVEGRVDEQIMRVGMAAIGIASCAIGLWAAASIVGGIIASGGPVAFLADWLSAVTTSI